MIKPELDSVVPPVSPIDLKAVWNLHRSAVTPDGKTAAIGMSLAQSVCSSDADMDAVTWRVTHMGLAFRIEKDALAPFLQDGEPSERVIEMFATFPFRFVEVTDEGVYRLNGEELGEELQELYPPVA